MVAKINDFDYAHVYVRFGDIPSCEFSYNHLDDIQEDGVSVFEGWQMPDGKVIIDPRTASFGILMFHSDRRRIIVQGTLLDRTGSDGEPLLTNCSECGEAEISGVLGFDVDELGRSVR